MSWNTETAENLMHSIWRDPKCTSIKANSLLKGTFHFGCDVTHKRDATTIFILVQAHIFRYSIYILLFVNVLPLSTCDSTAQIVSEKGYVPLA